MAALTGLFAPNPDEKGFGYLTIPVAASTKIFGGGMVAIDASGNAVPASDTAGLTVLGKAVITGGTVVDNSAGIAGALKVTVKLSLGQFAHLFDNDTVAPVTAAYRMQPVMVVDDHTVGATSAHSISAGTFVGFQTDIQGNPITTGTCCWILFAH